MLIAETNSKGKCDMKLQLHRSGAAALSLALVLSLAACGSTKSLSTGSAASESASEPSVVTTTANVVPDGATETNDLFTDRDLTQTPDLTDATYETLSDGDTLTITEAGVYVLSGTAKNAQVIVEAADSDKVQLVLDGLSITNEDAPVIYVKNADKVFVTTTDSENSLSVTGTFTADGDTNTDAVIFSKDDLVLNGVGTLKITSADNGISCRDDLKITGGTYVIESTADAIEANDSVSVADGSFTITSGKDGIHCENDEDLSVGSIYICGGTFDIEAGSDGIQGTTVTQIDGGTFTITAGECIESTYVQINGGTLTLSGTDDGINASQKSSAVSACVEITGGNLSITMAQGDTDAIDSNGAILVSGGNVDITAQFAFDFDTTAEHTGGTITVNGETVEEITASMMTGGGMGRMPGGMGDPGQMQGGMMGGPGQMPGGMGGPGGGHP